MIMSDAEGLVQSFLKKIQLLKGEIEMAWWRRGSEEEDKMMVEAADLVIDNLVNADNVKNIETLTSKNLRDQVTIEEIEEMDKDRKLRRWGFGRN